MLNPLAERLERQDLLSEEVVSTFDYSNIDETDKEELLECENELIRNRVLFEKSTVSMAEILYRANQTLAKYGTGTFMKWYENLGFKKDQVSYLIKRYMLVLEHRGKREYIAELPIRIVRELTRKDTPPEAVKEAVEKEIETVQQFKEIKNKYSYSTNNEKPNKIKETNNAKNDVIALLASYEQRDEPLPVFQIKEVLKLLREI